MKKVFTLALTALTLSASTLTAQQKIAVVSPDEIFAVMPEVKKADSSLSLYQNALAESYQNMQEELNNGYTKFVKDSIKMTPQQREVKRKELQSKITELQGKEQELNKDLEAKKEETLRPIREKMLKIIKEVAKDAGYNFVLYKEQTIVAPDADDITDKVKAKLGIKAK